MKVREAGPSAREPGRPGQGAQAERCRQGDPPKEPARCPTNRAQCGVGNCRRQHPRAKPRPSPSQLTLVSPSPRRFKFISEEQCQGPRPEGGWGSVREGSKGQTSVFLQTKGESRLRDGDSM